MVTTPATNLQFQDSGPVPKGVVGWLLFLCISMTIIAPAFHLRIAAQALWNLANAHVITLHLVLRLAFVGTLYIGLALFSFWAGFWLWREDPRAPSFAKTYLIAAPILVISLDVILVLTGTKINLPQVVFGRVTYSVIWLLYLSFSKRVQFTFNDPITSVAPTDRT